MPNNSDPEFYKRKKLNPLNRYEETHGGVSPWPAEYDRILTKQITNPYTKGDGFVTAAGWSWPNVPSNARCPGYKGSGSHIHTLWSIDNDWIGVNGDGIHQTNGQEGSERRWVLNNGDPRGGVFSPRHVDSNKDIVIPMHHDPAWAADYHFYFVSPPVVNGARLYSYDCSGQLGSSPTKWAGAIRVRRVYKLLGADLLEIWSGNDALWEIYIFSPGYGLVGYRQWWYQAKMGRQIFWGSPLNDSHFVRGKAFKVSF